MRNMRVPGHTKLRVLRGDELISPSSGIARTDYLLELRHSNSQSSFPVRSMHKLPAYFLHEGNGVCITWLILGSTNATYTMKSWLPEVDNGRSRPRAGTNTGLVVEHSSSIKSVGSSFPTMTVFLRQYRHSTTSYHSCQTPRTLNTS